MKTAEQIRTYLMKRHFSTHKGFELNDNTLLLEEKVIDSIGMIELIAFVEETYGIQIPDEDITPDQFSTISKLSRYIEDKHKQIVF